MEKFSIREVIEQAIRTERLGHDYYVSIARRFESNSELKNLFETLAIKEQLHEKRFSELKDKIKDEEPEGWEEASEYLRAVVESEFFLGKHKSLPSLAHVKTSHEAIDYALGFERETLLYYQSLKDVIEEKDIMNEIIHEEKDHIVWLHKFKNSLR